MDKIDECETFSTPTTTTLGTLDLSSYDGNGRRAKKRKPKNRKTIEQSDSEDNDNEFVSLCSAEFGKIVVQHLKSAMYCGFYSPASGTVEESSSWNDDDKNTDFGQNLLSNGGKLNKVVIKPVTSELTEHSGFFGHSDSHNINSHKNPSRRYDGKAKSNNGTHQQFPKVNGDFSYMNPNNVIYEEDYFHDDRNDHNLSDSKMRTTNEMRDSSHRRQHSDFSSRSNTRKQVNSQVQSKTRSSPRKNMGIRNEYEFTGDMNVAPIKNPSNRFTSVYKQRKNRSSSGFQNNPNHLEYTM